jgi:hypothetical protein
MKRYGMSTISYIVGVYWADEDEIMMSDGCDMINALPYNGTRRVRGFYCRKPSNTNTSRNMSILDNATS